MVFYIYKYPSFRNVVKKNEKNQPTLLETYLSTMSPVKINKTSRVFR